MNRLAIAGLTIIVALAMTGNSFAQGGIWGSGSSNRSGTPEKLAKTVGLTDEQVKKVKDVETARDKALADVQAAMKANSQAVQDASNNRDMDKLNEGYEQNRKLYAQYQEISKKFDDQRMAVLTDEQKTKLKEANDAQAVEQATQMYTQQYKYMKETCGLSDDQVKAMAAVCVACDKAMSQWESENKDKTGALQKARQEAVDSGDKEKVRAIDAEMHELWAPFTALSTKRDEDAFAMMKNEQKAKWLEQVLYQSFLMQFYNYDLSDDQKAKLKEACHTVAQEKGATQMSLWPKVEQEAFANILTDEQKTKWVQSATLQYIDGNYWAAKLTDGQKSKIKEGYLKLVADKESPSPATMTSVASTSQAMVASYKKLSPQVDAMLSNEQKAAMDKWLHPQKKSVSTSAPASK